jgi:hypothetical protein
MSNTETDWVRKAGHAHIKAKAQAIYDANDAATSRLDVLDGESLRLTLMEVINQCQDGRGFISSAELFLVAECLGTMR